MDTKTKFSTFYYYFGLIVPQVVVFIWLLFLGEGALDLNLAVYGGISLTVMYVLYYILEFGLNKDYGALKKFHDCHCRVDRTIMIGHWFMPVCARCTGINFGILLSPILFYLIDPPFYVFIIFIVPIIVDGYSQSLTSYVSTNTRRMITGIMFGFLVSFVNGVLLYFTANIILSI